LDNLPDVLIKLRAHEQSKSRQEYQPALRATRSIQLKEWNALLSKAGEIASSSFPDRLAVDEATLNLILSPRDCVITQSERVYRAFDLIDLLYDTFLIQVFPKYFRPSRVPDVHSRLDNEKQEILQKCLFEMKQRYVHQLISVTLHQQQTNKSCPDFVVPEKYQEQFHQLQTNQLKLSLVNFLSPEK